MRSELEPKKSQEKSPLLPNHKLLFPDPSSLAGAAFRRTQKDMGNFQATWAELDKDLYNKHLEFMLLEYVSILEALKEIVGQEDIIIVKNKVWMLKRVGSSEKLMGFHLPVFNEWESIEFKYDVVDESTWLRDAFTTVGGLTFLHPVAFKNYPNSNIVFRSLLGEGGHVISANKAVLVSEIIWRNRGVDQSFRHLCDMGFSIAPLPHVDPEKQGFKYAPYHIDGHAALIADKENKLHLLVSDSYSRQGNGTRKKIRFAAETIGAEIFEIDDRNLPPLALNFIQFEDKTILVSKGETDDLTFVLRGLIGEDKVLITKKPIVAIPESLSGGIRCMTNTLPDSVLNSLKK